MDDLDEEITPRRAAELAASEAARERLQIKLDERAAAQIAYREKYGLGYVNAGRKSVVSVVAVNAEDTK